MTLHFGVPSLPLVTVSDVNKRFSTVHAVNDLSFSVQPGQIFALLGPNGAGKSTMVRMLCGIFQPDSGSITYALSGQEVTTRTVPQQSLGYLPEDRGLYADKSIIENLLYFASLRGLRPADARPLAMEWLQRFSLAERAGDKLNTLSKGNQQKVQLVTAVLHAPRMAILDEPFTGFDPVNQDITAGMIRELSAAGMTVILSAHHMDMVESLADQILLMHQGRAVLAGSMEQIRARSTVGQRLTLGFAEAFDASALTGIQGVSELVATTSDTARLALTQDAQLSSVLHQVAAVAPLSSVRTETPTLREIYLAAVGAQA